MKIGIIGALKEEVEFILKDLENKTAKHIAKRQYHIGELLGHEVVAVFSGLGKVASTITAVNLLSNFDIDLIVFIGMAGSVNSNLNIGDVIVAKELFQHDMDARPFFKRYQIPLTDDILFLTDENYSSKALHAANLFLKNIEKNISKNFLNEFKIDQPKAWLGKIATGDQFIRTQDSSEKILEEMPETLAVEMEGAAIAQVCKDYNVPYVVIRTISDRADRSAHFDFLLFTNKIANIYSLEIIKGFLKQLNQE